MLHYNLWADSHSSKAAKSYYHRERERERKRRREKDSQAVTAYFQSNSFLWDS